MLRLALYVVFAIFAARAFWRLVDGIIEGVTGPRPRGQAPQRGVSMARDPVCGTFVLPERAVALGDGRSRLFFCSNRCRDEYRARTA
jgi:YHS domain-containing protein